MMQDGPVGAEALRLMAWADAANADRVLHVAGTESRAGAVARFLAAVRPDRTVLFLPSWDCLPYDWASPSPAAMGRRLATLRAMRGADGPGIVVTAPGAVAQRVPAGDALDALTLAVGEACDPGDVLRRLIGMAYRDEDRVDEPGEVVLRGAVLDVFPADVDAPVRIAFEDGRIASIRPFASATQRTTGDVEAVAVGAANEMPAEASKGQGIEHWLPEHRDLAPLREVWLKARLSGTAAALDRVDGFIDGLAAAHDERMETALAGGGGRRPLTPDRLYLTAEDWAGWRAEARTVPMDGVDPPPAIASEARPRAALRRAVKDVDRAVLVAATERDLERLERMAGGAGRVAAWPEVNAVASIRAPLDHGHRDGALLVLTARDVLGRATEDQTVANPAWLVEAQDLHVGDLVVHEDHGLARFDGLADIDGGEALRLVHADDEARLVPAGEAGLIWRYGADEDGVGLDRAGGRDWAKRRARFGRTIKKAAEAMVEAARNRAAAKAPVLEPDARGQAAVASGFPFEATAGQRSAIRAVLGDLASGTPMDRLLVGDVGFGKTEVAIRAVAAAALAGAQVAVVAPTTVLARQHAETFRKRLEPAGIAVGSLSRLTPRGAAKRVRAGLADGSVRVVVGTHAVVAKAVSFDRLGLVVIDEEQRFGRAHKKALRGMGAGVHILSMTATPIPGTLQGAIAGIRPVSVLDEAPARRRPIRTTVMERNDAAIRDALSREARRGGQSFVIVPRIADVDGLESTLSDLVPDLSVRVAHGDLPPRAVDETMTGFADGVGDVLLATAIVESGLDVPRANTMIVLRPEMMGMAQLHQLRGRLGRGNRQAYCWLLTDHDDPPSDAGRRRLDGLAAMDSLGDGMALSMADLDRRGAGDLFGEAQTGHDARIGAALHAAMLADALRAARGEPERARPDIRIDAPWRLPDDYIPRPEVRATLYVRLARVGSPAEAARIADEVEDRFGPPPPEARNALRLTLIRAMAARLGLAGVSAGPEAVALDGADEAMFDALPEGVERSGDRILLRRDLPEPGDRLSAAIQLLDRLS